MTKEELQAKLDNLDKQIDELYKERVKVQKEFEKRFTTLIDVKVGDKIRTSFDEFGTVISVDGPRACPIIVLFHSHDTDSDDTATFDYRGYKNGCSSRYTIEKI